MKEEIARKLIIKYGWTDDEAVNAIMELFNKHEIVARFESMEKLDKDHQQQIKELKGILRGKEGYALTDYEKLVAIEKKLTEMEEK